MRKTLTVLAIALSLSAYSQKQDSLIMRIEMDSTTWKSVVNLIQENINSQTTTGKLLLYNILTPLYKYSFVPREAIKQKEVKAKN